MLIFECETEIDVGSSIVRLTVCRSLESDNSVTVLALSQGSKRIVMVDNLARFSEFIDPSMLDLPSSTLAFEEEGKVRRTPSQLSHSHTHTHTHTDGVLQHPVPDVQAGSPPNTCHTSHL